MKINKVTHSPQLKSQRNFFQVLNTLSLSLFLSLTTLSVQAAVFDLPPSGIDIIGEPYIVHAKYEDTLLEIGERYEVGFDELKWANPNVNTWLPGEDTSIIIPSQYILPPGGRQGIVINIPEMRAYYFPKNSTQVYVYPVSVGRMDWKTPLGKSVVTAKQKDPAWYPPESIRREHLQDGRGVLPKVVPAGPDNPLGQHVLRLSIPSYLLHGTNDPTGIGMRVTHGCLRFFPKNIEELFSITPVGTTVQFINAPIKIGWSGESLYMEVHPPLDEDNLTYQDLLTRARQLLSSYSTDANISLVEWEVIELAIEQMSGIPVNIGRINDASRIKPINDPEEASWQVIHTEAPSSDIPATPNEPETIESASPQVSNDLLNNMLTEETVPTNVQGLSSQ